MRAAKRQSVQKPAEIKAANLMVRVSPVSKRVIARAATLRGVSTSDYVRVVVLAQARRELEEARTRTIVLSPEDQLALWQALHEPARLTERQRELARVMRGE
jgi:uncharacterized protein (DUF1778 family)